MIKLQKHQQIPYKFIKDHFGLILFHSPGSGKTITALVSMYQFNKDIIIIGPKSSKKIFSDEIFRLKYDASKVEFFSFKKIKNYLSKDITIFDDKSIIVDEAHHLRTATRDNLLIISALGSAYKVLLLTATPVINYLNDLAVLVNVAKKENVLPTEKNVFNFLYFDDQNFKILNEELLQERISDSISYYQMPISKYYPRFDTVHKKVIMNEEQIEEYSKYVRKITDSLIDDLDIELLRPKKKNFFLNVTRQLSNTVNGSTDFPKIKDVYNIVLRGPFPCIVYSNYLKNGIFPVIKLVATRNLKFKVITGKTSNDKIEEVVNDYNQGLLDVLFLSSAGSESLDLKNTRQIHLLEPHWNEAKLRQVIGRAIRFKSHESLPVKERHVDIYRWISIFPSRIKNKSADEYLIQLSEKKQDIFNKFKDIIIKSSIEHKKQ